MRDRVSRGIAISLLLGMLGCATYPDVKELKVIGYTEDVSKGQSAGQIEAADCLWYVLGYALGSYPDISKALANARTQRKSSAAEDMIGKGSEGKAIRYVNNVTATYDSFNAYLFGRTCIKVRGLGYL